MIKKAGAHSGDLLSLSICGGCQVLKTSYINDSQQRCQGQTTGVEPELCLLVDQWSCCTFEITIAGTGAVSDWVIVESTGHSELADSSGQGSVRSGLACRLLIAGGQKSPRGGRQSGGCAIQTWCVAQALPYCRQREGPLDSTASPPIRILRSRTSEMGRQSANGTGKTDPVAVPLAGPSSLVKRTLKIMTNSQKIHVLKAEGEQITATN
jgi:hypothetical protein